MLQGFSVLYLSLSLSLSFFIETIAYFVGRHLSRRLFHIIIFAQRAATEVYYDITMKKNAK
jgi:hypothetical protein